MKRIHRRTPKLIESSNNILVAITCAKHSQNYIIKIGFHEKCLILTKDALLSFPITFNENELTRTSKIWALNNHIFVDTVSQ